MNAPRDVPEGFDAGTVQVWTACSATRAPEDRADRLHPDDQVRLARLRNGPARHMFLLGRLLLRDLLRRYTGLSPSEQHLAFGPHGKPSLPSHPSLAFNLSHTRDTVVVAFSRGPAVGVDVEYLGRPVDLDPFMRRFFAPAECRALDGAGDPVTAFFRIWTAKEAYLKGLGLGLTVPLAAVDVHPSAAGRRVRMPGWDIFPLSLPDRRVGALALAQGAGEVRIDLKSWSAR